MNHSAAGSTYKSRFLFTAISQEMVFKTEFKGVCWHAAKDCWWGALNFSTLASFIFGQKVLHGFVLVSKPTSQPRQKQENFTRSFCKFGSEQGVLFWMPSGAKCLPFWRSECSTCMACYSACTGSVEPGKSAGANTSQTISVWDFFSWRIHFTSLNKQWAGTSLHHASSWWWTYNSTLRRPTTVLRTSLTVCMLISISGWNTSGGVLSVPNIKRFTRQILHFPNNYSFPFWPFSKAVTLCYWFVGWNTSWTMGAFFENDHHEAWRTFVWTGATSFWVDAFGVRCLLWCPGILSFATFIWALVGSKYVKPNGPGVFYILLWLREVWLLRLSGYSFAVSIWNHLCIISSIFYFELRFASGPILSPAAHSCEADEDFYRESGTPFSVCSPIIGNFKSYPKNVDQILVWIWRMRGKLKKDATSVQVAGGWLGADEGLNIEPASDSAWLRGGAMG